MSERLQKILAQAGFGSRREMEQWIKDGLVSVNGKVAKLGESVSSEDQISVRGKSIANPLAKATQTRILLYHKPIGEISSRHDPKFENTVFDNLPTLKDGRWIQVGRLDLNTSGLLLFTNDGELANRLMHPRYQIEREYAVRVYGEVTDAMLTNLLKGVKLDDGVAKFNHIEFSGSSGKNAWYNVSLSEGKNREVRRLWESQGVEVSRLIRIRFGNLKLPRSLEKGQYFELSPQQVKEFIKTI